MEIKKNGKSINVISPTDKIPSGKIPIIFLHGFTGSAEDWLPFFEKLNNKCFPIAIDLPGHGKTELPNYVNHYMVGSYVDVINTVLDFFDIKKTILLGYSMGGRVALSFTVAYPEKVIALILEGATAGIENEKERETRKKNDAVLIQKLLTYGIDKFINYWMDLPFFRSLKSLNNKEYDEIIVRKKTNSSEKLANSLLGFGTGQMPPLWNKLASVKIPVLLLAGSLDTKFVRINKKMNKFIHDSTLMIIEDCGHNTHLENKEKFIILVNNFLKELELK